MIVKRVREFLNSLVFAGNLVLAFDLYQVPFAKTLRSEMLGIFLRTKFY